MLNINNLSYSFPQKDLYNQITFSLEENQHCAFIGTSGSGKTTLIDMILKPENYMYDGKLELEDDCRIGYVSQFSQLDQSSADTVFEYIAKDYIKLQLDMEEICKEMETSTDLEPLLESYQQMLDAFSAIGGDDYESSINRQLNLANLMSHKDLRVSELSGGEFKLVQVIKEMLISPDLVIMDEPDVFLDFEHINSLKHLINSHKGILLIITHSRYLLNHCFNKIIHLENMELQEFDGSYIDYNFTLLQKKIELQELAIADDLEIERNEALIEKLRDIATNNDESSRGRSLNARVKIQERLEARRIKAPFVDIKQPEIELTTNHEVEETIALKVNDYSVAFEETLLEGVSFEIGSKDKVALIGQNGTGKTTLFRAIYNQTSDAIEVNDEINLAYLSQLQGEILNEDNTILDEFFDAGFQTNTEIKEYVAKYSFPEEMINQKISSLSGGEKNILQLAKISASHANMLLLDEPTSHLDTYSQIALEKAIAEYKGAILMISHDFYSIVNSVDYVLIIENKTIRKMSMRKFRKMIYKNHFNKDYLLIEQKKKDIETRIAIALKDKNFELAKDLSIDLETIIKTLYTA